MEDSAATCAWSFPFASGSEGLRGMYSRFTCSIKIIYLSAHVSALVDHELDTGRARGGHRPPAQDQSSTCDRDTYEPGD